MLTKARSPTFRREGYVPAQGIQVGLGSGVGVEVGAGVGLLLGSGMGVLLGIGVDDGYIVEV